MAAAAPDYLLALFEAKDLDAVIDATLDVLRTGVRCQFSSALYRQSGVGLLKERDSLGRHWSAEFMRRYAELTPAMPLALANRGISLLNTRVGLTLPEEELRRTAFYREVMQPQGWRHAVALCFWDDPPGELPVLVASVNRVEGRPDFSKRDLAALSRLHAFIDCAVSRLRERERARTIRDGMAMASSDRVRGLAILDSRLKLLQANQVARQLCGPWESDTAPTRRTTSRAWFLPTPLERECAMLLGEWRSLLSRAPDVANVHRRRVLTHATVPGLTASITMLSPRAPGLTDPHFVLEFDRFVPRVAPRVVVDAPVLAPLTAAERTVALVLADGLTNQEIADRLGKSVHAVKFLLHRIYRKTGVSSRAALVAIMGSPAYATADIAP
jgi:DNA-binding CsgD family transcriptional regulator